jgi:glucosylglycerate phosphorylase
MAAQDISARMRRRLELLYGTDRADGVLSDILGVVARRKPDSPRPAVTQPWSERDALLITYGDSVTAAGAPPLQALERFLAEDLGDAVTLVHVLPFYPYSSDDGFAVTDFRQVRTELGDWADIERLARERRLVFDAVINHVSASSVYMEGYARGEAEYADYFISLPRDTDTSKVLRTRNLPLLHDYDTARGKEWLWTTFSRDQVDLNFANPSVLLEIIDVLLFYAERGAAAIRLDAIPYLWKRLGTSCAHLPETHEIIKLIRDVYDLAYPEVLLLTETNVPHKENVAYFGDRGDEAQIIYNFSLPPLVLFSLVTGDGTKLTEWARQIERVSDRATYLNITATHDGIGMRPTEGILSEAERRVLSDLAYAHGGAVTGKRNPDGSISPYELNLNYFDAVNDPGAGEPLETQVSRFLVSQAVALAFIGIPGVYIHSLVGSRNDTEAVKASGIARRINRAKLDLGDLRLEVADRGTLRSRVFAAYKRMLAVRRGEKAFHPNSAQEVLDLGPKVFALRRTDERTGETIVAVNNLTNAPVDVNVEAALQGRRGRDLLGGDDAARGSLAAYQVAWIKAD